MSQTTHRRKTISETDTRPRGPGWEGLYVVATRYDDELTLQIELGQTVADLQSRQLEASNALDDATLYDALRDVLDEAAILEAVSDSGMMDRTHARVAVIGVEPDTGRVLDPVRLNAEYLDAGADVDALPFETEVQG